MSLTQSVYFLLASIVHGVELYFVVVVVAVVVAAAVAAAFVAVVAGEAVAVLAQH
jgi:hypothetical protein